MSELADCPFCGEGGSFVERADFSSAYVACNNCSARGPVKCQKDDEEETPGEASAIAAWNRRATPSPWRPIAEAPRDGTAVIVFHPEGGVCESFCPGPGFAWHVMDGSNTYIGPKSGASLPRLTSYLTDPTHWMPLPLPPSSATPVEGEKP